MPACTHLDQIQITELPESVEGCEDCLRMGGAWLHLRICLECGHVGCCDSSPNRHASGPQPVKRPPVDALVGAWRDVVVVLRGRGGAEHPGGAGPDADTALAAGRLTLRSAPGYSDSSSDDRHLKRARATTCLIDVARRCSPRHRRYGASTKVSTAMSGSMWLSLRKAKTLRPESRSMAAIICVLMVLWKALRLVRTRSASPSRTRLRSPIVSVSCRTTVIEVLVDIGAGLGGAAAGVLAHQLHHRTRDRGGYRPLRGGRHVGQGRVLFSPPSWDRAGRRKGRRRNGIRPPGPCFPSVPRQKTTRYELT